MDSKRILSVFSCSALCLVPMLAKAGSLSPGDANFMKYAAVAEMKEAHLAKIAEDRASRTGVKDFGRKLVQDETSLYQDLSVLSGKTGEAVPKGIDVRRDKSIATLAHLKGNAFERRYLARELQSHQSLVAACKKEAEHGQDANVKAYAQRMASIAEEDLNKLEDLSKPAK